MKKRISRACVQFRLPIRPSAMSLARPLIRMRAYQILLISLMLLAVQAQKSPPTKPAVRAAPPSPKPVVVKAKPVAKPKAAPATTTNVIFTKATIQGDQPIPKATKARIAGAKAVITRLLADFAALKTPKPIPFNGGSGTGKASIIKDLWLRVTGAPSTVANATIKASGKAVLQLVNTSLTVTTSSTQFLASAWIINSNSAYNVQGGETLLTGARLLSITNGTFKSTKATLKITDTPVNTVGSSWTLTDTLTVVSWSKPAPKVSASRPIILTRSTLTVNNGILRFVDVADIQFIRTSFVVTNANVELINSVAYVDSCVLNFKQITLKLTNSRLVIQKSRYIRDRFLRSAFGLPVKVPPPPFPLISALKPSFTSATGNFSLYSQNKF